MSRPDRSRGLLGTAEALASLCAGRRQPSTGCEAYELALWLRRRLDAWKPSWDGRRTALDEAARAYVVAALDLWEAHGAPGSRPTPGG